MATVKHVKRDNNHILVLLAETISYINVGLEKPSNEDIFIHFTIPIPNILEHRLNKKKI